jgi:hypothetical protein
MCGGRQSITIIHHQGQLKEVQEVQPEEEVDIDSKQIAGRGVDGSAAASGKAQRVLCVQIHRQRPKVQEDKI